MTASISAPQFMLCDKCRAKPLNALEALCATCRKHFEHMLPSERQLWLGLGQQNKFTVRQPNGTTRVFKDPLALITAILQRDVQPTDVYVGEDKTVEMAKLKTFKPFFDRQALDAQTERVLAELQQLLAQGRRELAARSKQLEARARKQLKAERDSKEHLMLAARLGVEREKTETQLSRECARLRASERQLNQVDERLQELLHQHAAAMAHVDQLTKQYERAQGELAESSSSRRRLHEEIFRLGKELEEKEAILSGVRSKVYQLKKEYEILQADLGKVKAERDSVQALLASAQEQSADARARLAEAESKINEMEKENALKEVRSVIAEESARDARRRERDLLEQLRARDATHAVPRKNDEQTLGRWSALLAVLVVAMVVTSFASSAILLWVQGNSRGGAAPVASAAHEAAKADLSAFNRSATRRGDESAADEPAPRAGARLQPVMQVPEPALRVLPVGPEPPSTESHSLEQLELEDAPECSLLLAGFKAAEQVEAGSRVAGTGLVYEGRATYEEGAVVTFSAPGRHISCKLPNSK